MARCYRLSMMALILLVLWGCGGSSSLEGQVVDGKGQPLANVKMIAKQVQPIKGYEQLEATTGGDGKFAFKGLFRTSAYEIFPYWDNQTASVRLKVESGPEGLTKVLPEPVKIRFTKVQDGVIRDNATGLEWYVGPDRDTNWNQAKSWTENLTAAGGGWRMPTIAELKAIYQQYSGRHTKDPISMDPIFQTTGAWVWSGQLRDASSAQAFHLYFGHETWGSLAIAGDKRAFAVRSRR